MLSTTERGSGQVFDTGVQQGHHPFTFHFPLPYSFPRHFKNPQAARQALGYTFSPGVARASSKRLNPTGALWGLRHYPHHYHGSLSSFLADADLSLYCIDIGVQLSIHIHSAFPALSLALPMDCGFSTQGSSTRKSLRLVITLLLEVRDLSSRAR